MWARAEKGVRPGQEAGGVVNGGHYVTIEGVRYLTRDIVWLLYTQRWPDKTLFHLDGNRLNYAIGNLAESRNGRSPAAGRTIVLEEGPKSWAVRINGRSCGTCGRSELARLIQTVVDLG